MDLRLVLHGEQQFTYHSMAHAGDTFTAADGATVAELTSTIVVRNPGAAK